jgi:hypothetical protein
VATQGQEGGSATIIEATWVPTLAAFIAVLSFLFALASRPETLPEILLADAIFVGSVSILVYRVEAHRASKGQGALFRGRPGRSLVLVAFAFGAIWGALAELASSSDPAPTPAIVIYERQVQEVLGPLRKAGAKAFKAASLDDPDLYAKEARELAEEYDLAGNVLGRIRPPRPGDHALHSLLVVRLDAVGEAYMRLGTAVDDGSPNIPLAEARAREANADFREAEEKLQQRGYRIFLVSRRS